MRTSDEKRTWGRPIGDRGGQFLCQYFNIKKTIIERMSLKSPFVI